MAKNPFEEVFEKISQLLAYAQEHEGEKAEIPEGVEEHLDQLEKQLHFLKEITEEMVEKAGGKKDLTAVQKQFLEKTERLKQETKEMERDYAQKIQYLKEAKKEKSKSGKKRKKKFKKLGGEGGWEKV